MSYFAVGDIQRALRNVVPVLARAWKKSPLLSSALLVVGEEKAHLYATDSYIALRVEIPGEWNGEPDPFRATISHDVASQLHSLPFGYSALLREDAIHVGKAEFLIESEDAWFTEKVLTAFERGLRGESSVTEKHETNRYGIAADKTSHLSHVEYQHSDYPHILRFIADEGRVVGIQMPIVWTKNDGRFERVADEIQELLKGDRDT